MKLLSFLQVLLPHLGKEDVLEDLRLTGAELEKKAVASYADAMVFFDTQKFASRETIALVKIFAQAYSLNLPNRANPLAEIHKRLDNMRQNVSWLHDEIAKIMERDIIKDGLTLRKALLLRAAECVGFASGFSLDFLTYIMAHEAIAADASLNSALGVSKVVEKNVLSKTPAFAAYLVDYGMPRKDFEKLFVKVPDVTYTPTHADAVHTTFEEGDIDPFRASVFANGFLGSPIYHARLLVAEWQAKRYHANQEKKKMLELRLLQMRLRQQKEHDPKIEQEISYTQSRVEKLSRSLQDVEASVQGA